MRLLRRQRADFREHGGQLRIACAERIGGDDEIDERRRRSGRVIVRIRILTSGLELGAAGERSGGSGKGKNDERLHVFLRRSLDLRYRQRARDVYPLSRARPAVTGERAARRFSRFKRTLVRRHSSDI
nr:hypothetical protein [Burkholderia ubonensis]